jgi:formiminotetrahydrofolate cyclodeaminase
MGEAADYENMQEEMAEAARSQTEHTEASLKAQAEEDEAAFAKLASNSFQ